MTQVKPLKILANIAADLAEIWFKYLPDTVLDHYLIATYLAFSQSIARLTLPFNFSKQNGGRMTVQNIHAPGCMVS
jgi:hypothetical protein